MMGYVIYFYCSDLDPFVLQQAKKYHQDITGISVTNDDMLCIEFDYYRTFERDKFLADIEAFKSTLFFDRYEVKS